MAIVRKITEQGFYKTQLPTHIWNKIKEFYEDKKETKRDEYVENDSNGLDFWLKSDKHRIATEKLEIAEYPSLSQFLKDEVQDLLEDWSGEKLKDGIAYGIRFYKDGASLKMHRDQEATHHIGANITVDFRGEPWYFHIEDHKGKLNKIYINPGEIVFYEASRLTHGRPESFNGDFYANLFFHYKLYDQQ